MIDPDKRSQLNDSDKEPVLFLLILINESDFTIDPDKRN